MGHAELQIEWYELTLKTIAARLSEERETEISSEQVGIAIAEQNDFSQNLQVFWYVLDNGLDIWFCRHTKPTLKNQKSLFFANAPKRK